MLLSLTQHGLYEKNCRDLLCAIVFGFNNDFKRVKSSESGKLENNFSRVVIARKEKEFKRIPSKFNSPEKKLHLLFKSLRN